MVLYRRPQDPEFTDDEEREMARLMRYVAHGLVRRSDQEDTFVDGPSRGLLVMNRAGVVIHVSAGAREMLYLATHAKVGPKEMHKSKTYVAVPPMLKLLCENLVDTFEGKPAEPPVFHHQNGWGRFTFRAYLLESVGVNDSGLIGVTVEQAEPQTLRIVRNMQALPLSPKQKEVCLLVATGHGNDEVAHRLNVSVTTVRDHLSKIYDKFAVHDRKDLILALAVGEDPNPEWYPSQRSSTSY